MKSSLNAFYATLILLTEVSCQNITPPFGDIVAGRLLTLDCIVSRTAGKGSVVWSIVDDESETIIYNATSCTQQISLVPNVSNSFTGICITRGAEDKYSLAVHNVTVDMDNYIWKCSHHTDMNSTAVNITVDVKVMVTNVVLVSGPASVQNGNSITATCFATASKPSACIRFFINPVGTTVREITTAGPACDPHSTSLQTTNRTLELRVLLTDNRAKVYCTATNNVTETPVRSQDYTLDVRFGPDEITLATDSGLMGNRVNVTEGNSVTFNCTSGESNPASEVSFYNNNRTIPLSKLTSVPQAIGPNNGYITSVLYTVSATRYQGDQVIKCEATRPRMTSLSSSMILNLLYGPTILHCQDLYTVIENRSVEVNCTSWAKPDATHVWKKGNMPLRSQTEAGSDNRQISKLTFQRISRFDAGIYNLSVSNIVNIVNRQITIIVKHSPAVTVSSPYGTEINKGSTLVLECQAEGVPQTYSYSPWTHYIGDTQIPLASNHSARRLEVHQVTFQDQGKYECTASNGIGDPKSNFIDVKIKAKPEFPVQKNKWLSSVGQNFTIKVGFVSYPHFQTITWYEIVDDTPKILLLSPSKYRSRVISGVHTFSIYNTVTNVSGRVAELDFIDVSDLDFKNYLIIVKNAWDFSTYTVSLGPEELVAIPDSEDSEVTIASSVTAAVVLLAIGIGVFTFLWRRGIFKNRFRRREKPKPPDLDRIDANRYASPSTNSPSPSKDQTDPSSRHLYMNTVSHLNRIEDNTYTSVITNSRGEGISHTAESIRHVYVNTRTGPIYENASFEKDSVYEVPLAYKKAPNNLYEDVRK